MKAASPFKMQQQQIAMTMDDWMNKLDAILTLNGRELLKNAGSISADIAKQISAQELKKLRDRIKETERARSLNELEHDMKALARPKRKPMKGENHD